MAKRKKQKIVSSGDRVQLWLLGIVAASAGLAIYGSHWRPDPVSSAVNKMPGATFPADNKLPSGTPTTVKAAEPRYIAHAGGLYQGRTYTNTTAALDYNYQAGYRLFEVDLNLTSDNQIVLLHDWQETVAGLYGISPGQRDLQSLIVATQASPFRVAQLSDLAGWARSHPDTKIVLDSKADAVALLTEVARRYPELRKRFIPYIYSIDQYQVVASLGFSQISLLVYADYLPSELINFARSYSLHSMGMSPDKVAKQSPELFKLVRVYSWTINEAASRDELFRQGVYGIVTDSLLAPPH